MIFVSMLIDMGLLWFWYEGLGDGVPICAVSHSNWGTEVPLSRKTSGAVREGVMGVICEEKFERTFEENLNRV